MSIISGRSIEGTKGILLRIFGIEIMGIFIWRGLVESRGMVSIRVEGINNLH